MRKILFPFSINLHSANGGYLSLGVQKGEWWSLLGIIACLSMFILVFWWRHKRLPPLAGLVIVTLTGFYGVIAFYILGSETVADIFDSRGFRNWRIPERLPS
jgi:hypothetical protein